MRTTIMKNQMENALETAIYGSGVSLTQPISRDIND